VEQIFLLLGWNNVSATKKFIPAKEIIPIMCDGLSISHTYE